MKNHFQTFNFNYKTPRAFYWLSSLKILILHEKCIKIMWNILSGTREIPLSYKVFITMVPLGVQSCSFCFPVILCKNRLCKTRILKLSVYWLEKLHKTLFPFLRQPVMHLSSNNPVSTIHLFYFYTTQFWNYKSPFLFKNRYKEQLQHVSLG